MSQNKREKGSLLDMRCMANQDGLGVRAFSDARNKKTFRIKKWLSPCKDDKIRKYKEYWDQRFWEKIGLRPDEQKQMKNFWPKGGPHWDALAMTEDGELLLIEAKAHISEFTKTSCKATSQASREKITEVLKIVAEEYGASFNDAWMNQYYQTANRLAHLWKLRSIPSFKDKVRLVYVFFLNDPIDKENAKREEWMAKFRDAEIKTLGVEKHRDWISTVFAYVKANSLYDANRRIEID